MNSKPENKNLMNKSQSHDAAALQDLTIQTLNEADADYAEEIKGGLDYAEQTEGGTAIKKATLTVRKAGGDQQEY